MWRILDFLLYIILAGASFWHLLNYHIDQTNFCVMLEEICALDHITMGSFMGRKNQYIQLVEGLYCKLSIIDKKLPSFPHRVQGLNL